MRSVQTLWKPTTFFNSPWANGIFVCISLRHFTKWIEWVGLACIYRMCRYYLTIWVVLSCLFNIACSCQHDKMSINEGQRCRTISLNAIQQSTLSMDIGDWTVWFVTQSQLICTPKTHQNRCANTCSSFENWIKLSGIRRPFCVLLSAQSS